MDTTASAEHARFFPALLLGLLLTPGSRLVGLQLGHLARVGVFQLAHVLDQIFLLSLGQVLEIVQQRSQLVNGQLVKFVQGIMRLSGGLSGCSKRFCVCQRS